MDMDKLLTEFVMFRDPCPRSAKTMWCFEKKLKNWIWIDVIFSAHLCVVSSDVSKPYVLCYVVIWWIMSEWWLLFSLVIVIWCATHWTLNAEYTIEKFSVFCMHSCTLYVVCTSLVSQMIQWVSQYTWSFFCLSICLLLSLSLITFTNKRVDCETMSQQKQNVDVADIHSHITHTSYSLPST